MTAPVSTVPAFKAWLFTQLQAACTQDVSVTPPVDLLVRYAEPGPFEPPDVVSLGAAHSREVKPFAMVGGFNVAGSLFETYTVDVDIDASRAGEDVAQSATERAWVLASAVENTVRADTTAGGAVLECWPTSSSDDPEWTDNGWLNVHITVSIIVQAVL